MKSEKQTITQFNCPSDCNWVEAVKICQEHIGIDSLDEKTTPLFLEVEKELEPILNKMDKQSLLEYTLNADDWLKDAILKSSNKMVCPAAAVLAFWLVKKQKRNQLVSKWPFLPSELEGAFSSQGISAPTGVFL